MRKIGPNRTEPIEVVGLSRLEATLAIVDKKLTAHGYKVRYDWVSARLLVLRNILLALGGLAVFLTLATVFVKEIIKETTTIEAFDVASDLEKTGLTGRVIAKKLYDQMIQIQRVALNSVNRKEITPSAWKLDGSITVPETKLTIGAIFSYLRSQLSLKTTSIDGEIVQNGDMLELTVRVRGKPHATYSGTRNQLDELTRRAAEHIYLGIEPLVLAISKRFSGDLDAAIKAATVAAASKNIDEAVEGLYEWGEALRSMDRPQEALQKFEEVLQIRPYHVRVFYSLTFLLPRLGRADEVEKRALAFIANRPKEAIGYAVLADAAFRKGDYVTSEKWCDKALSIEPDEPKANQFKGLMTAIRYRDYEASLRIGQRMMRVAHTSSEPLALRNAMVVISGAYLMLRDFDAAHASIQSYINERPGDPGGQGRLAQLQLARHQFRDALEQAEKAYRLGSVTAHASIVNALSGIGRVSDAIERAKAFVANNSRDHAIHLALGNAYLKNGQADEALSTFSKATTLSPVLPTGWLGLGRAHLVGGNLVMATQIAEKTRALAPRWSEPFVLIGDIHVASRDQAKAVQAYQQAIKLDPKWGEPYSKWGQLLLAKGDPAGAKELFAKAYALEPFNEEYKAPASKN